MVDRNEQVLAFGTFELYRGKKVLLEDGRPVRLGSRAFDILTALVERAGEVVGKNELMTYAWPNTFVEESNLRVHVASLRKILGDGHGGVRYIVNVSGRGYSFVASVGRTQSATEPVPVVVDSKKKLQLPVPLARAVGRADAVSAVTAQLARGRLVTIVGPGGVGKSSVALAAAYQLADAYAQRVCFVDLSAVADPLLVPAALATAVGMSVLTHDPVGSLVSFFRDQRMLILLDNCEHVIAAAAQMVEQILKGSAAVAILTTSREPLLAEGESLYRLPPLQLPPEASRLTAAVALTFPAVQLFVERATNRLDSFELTDATAAAVAGICRRLDGIPLAIELAAARIDLFGVDGLSARLDDRLLLLSRGRRTARPRHQSLHATLDWSYEILSPEERVILRRLALFRGAFSLESAAALVAGDPVADEVVLDGITSLAGKSLLTTQAGDNAIHYRLLQMTRTYAAEKLAESGEQAQLARRHAQHYLEVLEGAQADWEIMTRQQWLTRYGLMIDDVRSALDWAFSATGDVAIGASLTAAALPFGFQLSLIDEFKNRVQRALNSLASLSPPQTLAELRLNVAAAQLQWNTAGAECDVLAALARATSLADQTGLAKYKVEPCTASAVFELELGNYSGAVATCEELSRIAREADDPLAILIADRAAAQATHFAGDHARSRLLAERVLRHPAKVIPLVYSQTSVDRRVSMRIILARILWLEGSPEQAATVASECLELAASDGPFAICQALALAACPIALWSGDEDNARTLTASLLEYSRRYTFGRWQTLGSCYRWALDRQIGNASSERDAGSLTVTPAGRLQRDILATICDDWLDIDTITRATKGLCGWCGPEILRVVGEAELRQGGATADAAAELRFKQALALAREQQTLGWELRAASSLARLLQSQGRRAEADRVLRPVYERFTEGHETRDLRQARAALKTSY